MVPQRRARIAPQSAPCEKVPANGRIMITRATSEWTIASPGNMGRRKAAAMAFAAQHSAVDGSQQVGLVGEPAARGVGLGRCESEADMGRGRSWARVHEAAARPGVRHRAGILAPPCLTDNVFSSPARQCLRRIGPSIGHASGFSVNNTDGLRFLLPLRPFDRPHVLLAVMAISSGAKPG